MEAQTAASAQLLQETPEAETQTAKETKSEAFVRLAEPRVEKALTALRRVGNLGARSQYEYFEPDVEAIVSTLQQALDDMASRFRDRPRHDTFKLPR